MSCYLDPQPSCPYFLDPQPSIVNPQHRIGRRTFLGHSEGSGLGRSEVWRFGGSEGWRFGGLEAFTSRCKTCLYHQIQRSVPWFRIYTDTDTDTDTHSLAHSLDLNYSDKASNRTLEE